LLPLKLLVDADDWPFFGKTKLIFYRKKLQFSDNAVTTTAISFTRYTKLAVRKCKTKRIHL